MYDKSATREENSKSLLWGITKFPSQLEVFSRQVCQVIFAVIDAEYW